jgi:CRISPR/Cas system CSM-associated protein Csm2 small subunit
VTWNEVRDTFKPALSEDEIAYIEFIAEMVTTMVRKLESKGLTVDQFAEQIGLPPSEIRYLYDIKRPHRLDTVFKALHELGLELQIVEKKS